jgi:hypothetical protein
VIISVDTQSRVTHIQDMDMGDTDMVKTLADRIAHADMMGCKYLADANEAAERGKHEKAEKLYAKGQYWLDRYNRLVGDA